MALYDSDQGVDLRALALRAPLHLRPAIPPVCEEWGAGGLCIRTWIDQKGSTDGPATRGSSYMAWHGHGHGHDVSTGSAATKSADSAAIRPHRPRHLHQFSAWIEITLQALQMRIRSQSIYI